MTGPGATDGRPADGHGSEPELPAVDALRRITAERSLSFHMPGHKQGRRIPVGGDVLGPAVWAADLSELGGFDYLHSAGRELARAQELTAELFGADRSFFLVNGSTVGNIAALVALAGDGDVVVTARASHRSVWAGVMLSGADVAAAPPVWHPALQGWFGASVHDAARLGDEAVAAGRRVAVVHVTNPSYYGLAPDLAAWRVLADRWGAALVVDEAHGTHFAFADGLPPSGLSAGADVVVQSPHKTAGALTQASWLHVRARSGARAVDPARIGHVLGQLQSSSPSALLTASLDMARAQLARSGRADVTGAVGRARELRRRLVAMSGLSVPGEEALLPGVVAAVDPTKLLVSAAPAGLSGFELDRRLRARGVEPEFADDVRVVVSITWADDDDTVERFAAAVASAVVSAVPEGPAAGGPTDPSMGIHSHEWAQPERVLSIRAAARRAVVEVPLEQAVGMVSAEYLIPYPPGIPAILPGERIDATVIAALRELRRGGAAVVGPADPTGRVVRAVAP